MTEEQKKRLADLKENNRSFVLEQRRKQNVLLQECITSLGPYCRIVDADIERQCQRAVNAIYEQGLKAHPLDEIPNSWCGKSVYLVWDERTLPVLHCDFEAVRKAMDDVLAVSFETWFVSEGMDQVVFINRGGDMELFLLEDR